MTMMYDSFFRLFNAMTYIPGQNITELYEKKMTKSVINGTFCFAVYKERQNKIVKPTLKFVHTTNRKSVYLHFTCTC